MNISVIGTGYVGFVLCAHIMGQRVAWNHEALFDYEDRWWNYNCQTYGCGIHPNHSATAFSINMWSAYRVYYPPVWNEDTVFDAGAQ